MIVVLPLLVIGWVLWYQRSEKDEADASAAILSDALQVMSQLEGYEQSRQRVDELVRMAHPQAFQFASDKGHPGGRLRAEGPATFDHDKYMYWLFLNMTRAIRGNLSNLGGERAEAERQLLRSIEELRKKLGIKGPLGS